MVKLLPFLFAGISLSAVASPPSSACAGKRYCDETASFAAIVRDFRPSISDRNIHIVSATVRFLNKTNRPLILGYVQNGAVAIDEQGNRYVLASPQNVRGIGVITGGREFDPKFNVAPGQTADAQFEFVWQWNGRDIIGQRAWDVSLTVREVQEVAPGQFRFAKEDVVQFKALPGANNMNSGAMPTAVAPGPNPNPPPAQESAAAPMPAPEPDACAGRPRCYDAGAFMAEIVQANLTHEGNFQDRIARLSIRFRNKTNEPVILGYVARSGTLIDNLGNRFNFGMNNNDGSAAGIGVVSSNKADPQFVLRPGETRDAMFTLFRYRPPKNDPDGSGYTYTVSIAQLQVLYNGQQVRTLRETAMTFPDFGMRAPMAGAGGGAPGNPTQGVKQLGDTLRGIWGKK